jgi:hypothetical protein
MNPMQAPNVGPAGADFGGRESPYRTKTKVQERHAVVIGNAYQLQRGGDTELVRTAATNVVSWDNQCSMFPSDPGVARMLHCAVLELEEALGHEDAVWNASEGQGA